MSSVVIMTLAIISLAGGAQSAHAQDALADARERYAEADYEGALALLDESARGASVDGSETHDVDQLRVLCLLALGRGSEATSLIEQIVTADPRYQPGDDYSPRVRLAFSEVRERVLPLRAREKYDEGRRAYDRNQFAEAASALEEALPVIEALASEERSGMADLQVLAREFLSLARERTPSPPAEREPPPALAPPMASDATAPASSEEPETPPVVIVQQVPQWRYGLAGVKAMLRGAIDVVIDERGHVVSATISTSVHPSYDRELLKAARSWRYEPARRGGEPVPSRKRVEVMLELR